MAHTFSSEGAGDVRSGLTAEDRATILRVAREAIRFEIERGGMMPVDESRYSEALRAQRATFVTLHMDGPLLGCIGTLQARESLVASVARNARAAAFDDPRSPGVRMGDLDRLEIEVSILSPLERIEFSSEEDLLAQLRPGVDGVVLEERFYRGTFLPAVWESLPEKREFLDHLKLKAGLPIDYWSPTLSAYRYTVELIEA